MSSKKLPDYIQVLLVRIIEGNGIRNYSLKIKQGSEVGDGFMSELSCIKIINNDDSEKNMEIVCKIAPINPNRRKEFFSNIVFERESFFYNKLMPAFVKFQAEKNVPINHQFRAVPKCYAAIADDDSEQYVIMMEDLRQFDFKMWNKAKAVPIENMRLVMRELGKFHGLSFAMKHQKPNEFAEFRKLTDISHIFLQSENMQGMFDMSFDRAIKALKREDHKNVMRALKKNTLAHFQSCLNDEVTNRFGVVSHGDFWNNNILYQFNEDGVAEDVRFLDWQVIRFTSPAIDLLYNIFTSTSKALRDKEYDNLLKIYHDSLSNIVKLHGSNPNELFTFDDLKSELKICGVYALLLTPMLLSVSLADSSEISNLDEMCDQIAEGERQKELITGLSDQEQIEYNERLNDVVEDLINLGYYNPMN